MHTFTCADSVVPVVLLEACDLRVVPPGPGQQWPSLSTMMVVSQVAPVLGNVLTLPDATITITLDVGMGGEMTMVVCQRQPHLVNTEQHFARPSRTSPHIHLEREPFSHTLIETISRTSSREEWSLPG